MYVLNLMLIYSTGIYFILGIGVLKILAELALAYKLDTVTVSWQDFVYDMLLRGKVCYW